MSKKNSPAAKARRRAQRLPREMRRALHQAAVDVGRDRGESEQNTAIAWAHGTIHQEARRYGMDPNDLAGEIGDLVDARALEILISRAR